MGVSACNIDGPGASLRSARQTRVLRARGEHSGGDSDGRGGHSGGRRAGRPRREATASPPDFAAAPAGRTAPPAIPLPAEGARRCA